MAGLDFSDKVQEASKDLKSMEQMLGKGLLQPFSNLNAGARKIMHSTHRDHIFPLISGEKAIIETGYENRFGDYSSSVTKADANYRVIAKISKYSFAPNHHYWLILEDVNEKKLDVQERISYHHITQSYGYLYNNEYMDSLDIGDIIPKDTVVQKSLAFDEYNNRKDGINFNVAYMALDDNMEDSMIFSDEAAGRLTAPLIKPVEIMINNNDIPLNLYGNDGVYKIIPDIGEEIKDANLIVLRKEKKEEAYYTQSVENLSKIMMSDSARQIRGKVIDVDIYCNNPEILDSLYYQQLKMYHNELMRYSTEFIHTLMPYVSQKYKLTYELQKLYGIAKRVVNHDQYIDKKPFSNIILNITVLDEIPMNAGDKASNRYGGKGVVSEIWPKQFMPRFKNAMGEYEYVDVIFNSSTMINRENVGQNFELSINHIGSSIIGKIQQDNLSLDDAYNMIHKFISMCSPQQAEYMEKTAKKMTRDELAFFIESIIESGNIQLSMRPISDTMTIDKLAQIYHEFPWVEQNKVEVALRDSEGNIRYIPSRRTMVIGKQYIFRLKQFSEEKFSATSLSSTNLRNENIKSKSKKISTSLYSNTPIRFGKQVAIIHSNMCVLQG
jgi:DNA-directed RNA polymerase beta subunit